MPVKRRRHASERTQTGQPGAHGIAIVRRPALETVAMATEQRRRSFGEGQDLRCESWTASRTSLTGQRLYGRQAPSNPPLKPTPHCRQVIIVD
jgi:hypothetical protein